MPSRKSIAELLNRRRRQILVHSVIYYKMNDNLISDSTWSAWAAELEELQAKYPGIAAKVPYAKELDDPWAVNKARQLIALKNKGAYGQYEQLKIPM